MYHMSMVNSSHAEIVCTTCTSAFINMEIVICLRVKVPELAPFPGPGKDPGIYCSCMHLLNPLYTKLIP